MPPKMFYALGQPPGDVDRHVACRAGDIDEVEPDTSYTGLVKFREFVVGNCFVDDGDAAAGDRAILYGGQCDAVVCSVDARLNNDSAFDAECAEHRKVVR